MSRYYALVPAAGSGSRLGEALPKQYRSLAGRPLIRHALAALCGFARLERVFVVLAPDDAHWAQHDWSDLGAGLETLRCGGATRAESVLNGLRAISHRVAADDWIMVHDAARPCLTRAHLEALVREAGDDEVGAILAVPVADTLKRAVAQGGRIAATLPREGLWQAQTPQMFRHSLLQRALEDCREVTDEASAIERLGLRPRLVAADASNLKVTYPLDLHLAGLILADREGGGA
jgi:2-C-methyl-D-erythritol 4-phosphate cytidylyltransferase